MPLPQEPQYREPEGAQQIPPEVVEQIQELTPEELAEMAASLERHPAGADVIHSVSSAEVPYKGDPEPSMADPEMQRMFDEAAIEKALGNLRSQYASKKLQHHLAFRGLIFDEHGAGLHPNQLEDDLAELRRSMEGIIEIRGLLTDTGLPDRSESKLATASPADVAGVVAASEQLR